MKIDKAIGISALLYGFSLVLPVFYTSYNWGGYRESAPMWFGIEVLLVGWLHMFSSPDNGSLAWLANPVYLLALWQCERGKFGNVPLALLAFCLALSAFLLADLFTDRSPPAHQVTGFGPGVYVWLLAIFLLFLRAVVIAFGTVNRRW